MRFTIDIDLDNAAFEYPEAANEVSRILSELARTIARDGVLVINGERRLNDINGNSVGVCKLHEK